MGSNRVPKSDVLKSLFDRDKGRCCHCGCQTVIYPHEDIIGKPVPPDAATREHLIPRAWGGPSRWWNMAISCRRCNNKRGNRPMRFPDNFYSQIPKEFRTKRIVLFLNSTSYRRDIFEACAR